MRNNLQKTKKNSSNILPQQIQKRETKQLEKLENHLLQNNTKQAWKEITNMKNNNSKHDPNQDVPPYLWLRHFKNLYETQSNIDNHLLKQHENNTNPTESLDKEISTEEILIKIKSTSSKKSPDFRGISNRLLKSSRHTLCDLYHKLFNLILKTNIFPENWAFSTITPIHKKGNSNDPNNYRGLSIGHNLAKIFCSILNDHLTSFLSDKN